MAAAQAKQALSVDSLVTIYSVAEPRAGAAIAERGRVAKLIGRHAITVHRSVTETVRGCTVAKHRSDSKLMRTGPITVHRDVAKSMSRYPVRKSPCYRRSCKIVRAECQQARIKARRYQMFALESPL
jgi:hypothetical protein